jgi:flagellar biosynthesis/type III secretory pathway protein FliH
VLRGYDRVEVDQYIRGLLEENAALRRDVEAGRAALRDRASARRPEASPNSRHYDVDTPSEDSFGFRAEKLLRLAEQEAAEMRAGATRDAQAVESAARRRAEEQLRAAEAQAEDIRARASEEAASSHKQVSQETARLDRLYRSMKGEIQRLAELLNNEAQRPDPDGGPARADEPTSGTAATHSRPEAAPDRR